MNVNVLALKKAMDLAGKRSKAGFCRVISPQHYAAASGLDWYAARRELRSYAECGVVHKTGIGKFWVMPMDYDD